MKGEINKLDVIQWLSIFFNIVWVWFVPVSPDGLLLQSSTVADSKEFEFSDGFKDSQVPASYIEFAQRLVLPQFKNLPEEEVSLN